jgi:hypothetical protein
MTSAASPSQRPYPSAISGDPFADADGTRRRIIAVAVAILVGLCGVGMLFAMMNF